VLLLGIDLTLMLVLLVFLSCHGPEKTHSNAKGCSPDSQAGIFSWTNGIFWPKGISSLSSPFYRPVSGISALAPYTGALPEPYSLSPLAPYQPESVACYHSQQQATRKHTDRDLHNGGWFLLKLGPKKRPVSKERLQPGIYTWGGYNSKSQSPVQLYRIPATIYPLLTLGLCMIRVINNYYFLRINHPRTSTIKGLLYLFYPF
jgi:hypothetical protein